MAFYVDRLKKTRRTKCWPYDESCHLLADTEKELRRVAVRLHLSPKWIQRSSYGMPHFDLTPAMRLRAIDMGAIELHNRREVKKIIDVWKARYEEERNDTNTKGEGNER